MPVISTGHAPTLTTLKPIQDLLGHATIQMTMRYPQLAPEVARDAVRPLDSDEAGGETEKRVAISLKKNRRRMRIELAKSDTDVSE